MNYKHNLLLTKERKEMSKIKNLLKFNDKDLQLYKLERDSSTLIGQINWYLILLDKIMLEKESCDRGKKVAEIINRINIELDKFMHFTMGVSFKKIEELRNMMELAAKDKEELYKMNLN